MDNVIYGRNPVKEALKSERKPDKILMTDTERTPALSEIYALARKNKIPVQSVDKKRLDALAEGGNHQGVAAVVPQADYASLEDVFQKAEDAGEAPFLILLDGIEDPQNLGSVIRTAECAGAHGVIIPKNRAVGLTAAAVRVSSGAAQYMPVVRVTNLNQTIDLLKERGVWIAGASMEGQDYAKAPLEGAIGLVIGAEGKGISRVTREKCDFLVSLPVLGHIDSLNAAVAAGILMYEVRRRRS